MFFRALGENMKECCHIFKIFFKEIHKIVHLVTLTLKWIKPLGTVVANRN